MLNSQNGKRPLTVNGQYCKQLLLLCLRLLPLIPLLFLSFSNRSRESKGSCAYRDNSGAHTHTGGHSHGLTHTHAHLQALQVRFAYRDNSAVQHLHTGRQRHTHILSLTRMHTCTQVKPVLGASQSLLLLLLLQFTVQRCSSAVKKNTANTAKIFVACI